MDFVNASSQEPPGASVSSISNVACFGAGCYWGTEKFFKIDFGRKRFPGSILRGQVGFMGPAGAKENPTYVEVCSGSTGHVEVYHVEFGGGESELSLEKMYEELVRFFFQFHDSTTTNRQEQDVGTQYASCIFVYDDKQREIAERVRSDFQSHLTAGRVGGMAEDQVKTVIFDATVFFPAHEEHQEYLAKNPNGYCNHRIRFPAWPEPCEP